MMAVVAVVVVDGVPCQGLSCKRPLCFLMMMMRALSLSLNSVIIMITIIIVISSSSIIPSSLFRWLWLDLAYIIPPPPLPHQAIRSWWWWHINFIMYLSTYIIPSSLFLLLGFCQSCCAKNTKNRVFCLYFSTMNARKNVLLRWWLLYHSTTATITMYSFDNTTPPLYLSIYTFFSSVCPWETRLYLLADWLKERELSLLWNEKKIVGIYDGFDDDSQPAVVSFFVHALMMMTWRSYFCCCFLLHKPSEKEYVSTWWDICVMLQCKLLIFLSSTQSTLMAGGDLVYWHDFFCRELEFKKMNACTTYKSALFDFDFISKFFATFL